MEGLKLALANLRVYLHPSKANAIRDADLDELRSHLFLKFVDKFDGVVLACKPNIPSDLARILPGPNPYIEVNLQEAELLLFNPKPNMIVEGEVKEVGAKSILAVVLGSSLAFIRDRDILEKFYYVSTHVSLVFFPMKK